MTTVSDVALDAGNRATIRLRAGEKGVLIVLAVADFADELARYQVSTLHY